MLPAQDRQFSLPDLLGFLLLAGVSLLAFLGSTPCQSSQEASVLVAAREMAQDGGSRWLLPTCNGELCLQQPPLPYWLSAGAFGITRHTTEFVGRLPFALAAWLTLALVYIAGGRWFGRRTGLLAAAMLLTSYLFYRHGRLAETDIAAAFAVTAAVLAFWRALELAATRASLLWSSVWFAVGGAATGAAFLAKQDAGAYPLLFLLAMGLVRRNWRGLAIAVPAALIPAVLVAAPWYAYIAHAGYWNELQTQLRIAAAGDDHPGGPVKVIVAMFVGTLPWSALWPAALIGAAVRRRDPAVQGLLCWLGAALVPLFFTGNKQIQSLLPAMPPLMLLVAWVVDTITAPVLWPAESAAPEASRKASWFTRLIAASDARTPVYLRRYIELAVPLLLIATIVAGLAMVGWAIRMFIGYPHSGTSVLPVATLCTGILLLLAGTMPLARYRGAGAAGSALRAAGWSAIVFPVLLGWWAPQLVQGDIRNTTALIRQQAGARPLVVPKPAPLALVFQLKQVVPTVSGPAELANVPEAAVIVPSSPEDRPAKLPEPWRFVWRGGPDGHHYQVFLPGGR